MSRLFPRLLLALLVLCALPARADELERADAMLRHGDPRAAEVVSALASARPADPRVGVLKVRLLMLQKQGEQAVEAAEALVATAPGDAAAHLWLGMAYGNRIGSVGMFAKASMAPKIRAAFERAVELDPALHQASLALVEYYLQAPSIVGGSVAKAEAVAKALRARDPAFGQFALARLAMQAGRADEARKLVLAAHATRPDEAQFRMAAGLLHQDAREWDQAFAVFEAWARDEPESASAWYQVGRTAVLSEQRLDEGVEAFRRVLALHEQPGAPGHQHAWWRMGQALALQGDKARARQAFERALALDPELAEARDALAKL